MRYRTCSINLFSLLTVLIGLFVGIPGALAWFPGPGSPSETHDFSLDRTSRIDVLAYSNTVYGASNNFAAEIGWNGDIPSNTPGITSATFQNDVVRRINFYRALAGVNSDVVLSGSLNANEQSAALMFAYNSSLGRGITHTPTAAYAFYSEANRLASSNSLLSLGTFGPAAIDAYMIDSGTNNAVVGHRRWLLFPASTEMGSGDVPTTVNGTTVYHATNALWVIPPAATGTTPAPVKIVTWPAPGYFPCSFLPTRWSFTYPQGEFSQAQVSMVRTGTGNPVPISTSVISRNVGGQDYGDIPVGSVVGDNSFVWTPAGVTGTISADTNYKVTISGVRVPSGYTTGTVSGTMVITGTTFAPAPNQPFIYNVTLFDANVLGQTVNISGTNKVGLSGTTFTFNPIVDGSNTIYAEGYNLRVSEGSSVAWNEGAEDLPVGKIIASTSGTYPLRESAAHLAGKKSFHLAFPDFSDQMFIINREIVASPSKLYPSYLTFAYLSRLATPSTKLNAEVSTDNGNTWTSVWQTSGIGLSFRLSQLPAWRTAQISLAPFAGKNVIIRFILHCNPPSVIRTTYLDGFYIDAITVTGGTQMINSHDTLLAAGDTSFTLDSSSVGAPLASKKTYYLRIQPRVGSRWFGFGPATKVSTP